MKTVQKMEVMEVKMMKRKEYKRIVFEDRQKIEQLYADGKTPYEIAVTIGVHPVTIDRELKRGGNPYSADVAQKSL